jgi:hypothetical protein
MTDETDDFSQPLFNFSFKPQTEIRHENRLALAEKDITDLSHEEIFELIRHRLRLSELIPLALDVLESGRFLDFEDPYDTPLAILEGVSDAIDKNRDCKERFRRLKKWDSHCGECVNIKTGKSRVSYSTEYEAELRAQELSLKYDGEQNPYRCNDCGQWHLSPKSRQTPSKECSYCTDSDGNPKQLYFKKGDAHKRADILQSERGVYLEVYECPIQSGWHLTKG